MRKLFIVGPKSKLETVTKTIHSKQNTHILDHKKDEEYDLASPMKNLEDVSGLLVEVRALLAHLGDLSSNIHKTDLTHKDITSSLPQISKEIKEIIDKQKQAQQQHAKLDAQQQVLKELEPLSLSPEDFENNSSYSSFFGSTTKADVTKKLEAISDKILIKGKQIKDKLTLGIFVEADKSSDVEQVLASNNFAPIDVSAVQGMNGSAHSLLSHVSKDKKENAKEQSSIAKEIEHIKAKHQAFLYNAERLLHKESEIASAPLRFGSTKETFFLRAYVPEKEIQDLKKELMKATKEALYVEDERIKETDDVPIKLNNPKGINNFEFFTNLYSLPNYKEFDPTILMAFTFPLFFGFMLGDMVYGLIMIGLFYFLKKKFPVGKDFFTIMMFAGFSAFVFGAAYGEILGFEPWGSHGAHGDHGAAPAHDSWYPLLERTIDFVPLMIIAGIVGVVHVNLGLLIGAFLEFRNHGVWHALTHRISWIFIQIGLALGVGPLMDFYQVTPLLANIGWASLAFGTFLLYKAEGFIGIMEMPTIISHTLSYMRLMAVGLASVFIAVMVNQFAAFLYGLSLWWLPVAAIVMILGHTFAIGLGILSPSLHSIRLHYVEFFTKFYKGGGTEYVPFGAEKKQSLL